MTKNINQAEKLKIAIVGAGIGGCACAYFLSSLFDHECVSIDVYEKSNEIGGRLSTFNYKNKDYETGGSILHPGNIYMDSLRKICGLEKLIENKEQGYYLGIFDKNSLVFSNSRDKNDYFGFLEKLNLIRHFGFLQLLKFYWWLKRLTKEFEGLLDRIYKLQDEGFTFDSIDEFLQSLSGKLYNASKMTTKQLLEKENFSSNIINQLANVATLANYGQDTNINGFVGLVSLAGISVELWSIKNGNKQVAIKLIEKSKVNLIINTNVTHIIPSRDSSKNHIIYVKDGAMNKKSYDYVIVAFPLTNQSDDKFLSSFNYIDHLDCEIHFNQACLVEGCVLKPSRNSTTAKKELKNDKRIELFSCDVNTDCRIITAQLPCDGSLSNEPTQIFKTFSPYDLTDNMLKKVFNRNYKVIKKCNWQAFPKYEKNSQFKYPGIYIDSKERSRVFYLNSIEWTASCMEMSCIGARNIALLISNKEQSKAITKLKNKKFSKFNSFESNNDNFTTWTVLIIISAILVFFFSKRLVNLILLPNLS